MDTGKIPKTEVYKHFAEKYGNLFTQKPKKTKKYYKKKEAPFKEHAMIVSNINKKILDMRNVFFT